MGTGRARSGGLGRIAAVMGSVTVVMLGVGSRVEARAATPATANVPSATAMETVDGWRLSADPADANPADPWLRDAEPADRSAGATAPTRAPVPVPAVPATVPTTTGSPATTTPPATRPLTTLPPTTLPPTTPAPTTFPPETAVPVSIGSDASVPSPGPEARGRAVLATINVDVPALIPGWSLEFKGADPGYRGSTFPGERRIEIYVRDDLTDAQVAHTIGHEVAHAMDVDRLDDAAREQWLQARGRTGLSWWATSGVSDYAVGSGDLAESVAWILAGGGEWNSTVGGPPGPDQQRVLRSLLPLG